LDGFCRRVGAGGFPRLDVGLVGRAHAVRFVGGSVFQYEGNTEMKSDGRLPNLNVMVALLGLLLGREAALSVASEPGRGPVLAVPVAGSKPVIDGRLDEPCWKRAARTGPLRVTGGKASGATTEAFILRHSRCLYIGVGCRAAGEARPGTSPEKADFVELLIDSNGDGNSYYRICILRPPGGQLASSYNERDPPWCDRTWQPPIRWSVAETPEGWAAELALPFEIFNKNRTLAAEIGFNIRRSGMPEGEIHCWHGTFADPNDAGTLTGIPAREHLPEPEYVVRGLTRWYRPPNKAGRLFLAEQAGRTIQLGPGSAHPGTTGEVTLELEAFLLEGDPHARALIWDLAVDEKSGELYVLSDTRPVRGVAEVRVFDRQGEYLRTVVPLNPNLGPPRVQDLCRSVAVEGGCELVIPKLFQPWGEPSFYGDWWHHPQKLVVGPGGKLVMSNIYRGILWRLNPDGSLPADGWTSVYNHGRNEPFESTVWTQESWHVPDLKNYLPFHALHYPYFHFAPDGSLFVSAGQSSRLTKLYAYHFEVSEADVRYHWQLSGGEQRSTRVWKCRILPGPRLEHVGALTGFSEPCGVVVHGDQLIVADAGNNRLQVLDRRGRKVASITHYERDGAEYPLHDPTALGADRKGHLYVLVGSERRPPDVRSERTLRSLQEDVHGRAALGAGKPRKLIKLKSWKQPELLAASRPLDPDVLQIAVDAGVSPPLVWVANGAGPGSLLRLAGDDLSVIGQWADDGRRLSCPRQSGGMPILNIDPETGHIYVEDDSNYRLKQYGTVYRLDQKGNVLKKWPPFFFDARGAKMTSPWFTLDYERHFRYPAEPLFIDSIFGKDGRIYRWKLTQAGVQIVRFDRHGNPVPFRATGTNALFVDHALRANWWHDVYHGMDVDRHGKIYYVAKVDVEPEARPVSPYFALHRQINVYDAEGNLEKRGLLELDCVRGIQVDDEGNLYVLHRPADRPWQGYLALSKYSPAGDVLWSRRWDGLIGEAQVTNPPCHCTTFRLHQVLDRRGYLYAADKYSVQVIDCDSGRVVGRFGSYGNMDSRGRTGRFPHPELPFGMISALCVWKDRLFAVDVLNRRIVKCRIVYHAGARQRIGLRTPQ